MCPKVGTTRPSCFETAEVSWAGFGVSSSKMETAWLGAPKPGPGTLSIGWGKGVSSRGRVRRVWGEPELSLVVLSTRTRGRPRLGTLGERISGTVGSCLSLVGRGGRVKGGMGLATAAKQTEAGISVSQGKLVVLLMRGYHVPLSFPSNSPLDAREDGDAGVVLVVSGDEGEESKVA